MKDGLLRNHKINLGRPAQPAASPSAPVQNLCWCGSSGHYGFTRGGSLFCAAHVVKDADGVRHPIHQP